MVAPKKTMGLSLENRESRHSWGYRLPETHDQTTGFFLSDIWVELILWCCHFLWLSVTFLTESFAGCPALAGGGTFSSAPNYFSFLFLSKLWDDLCRRITLKLSKCSFLKVSFVSFSDLEPTNLSQEWTIIYLCLFSGYHSPYIVSHAMLCSMEKCTVVRHTPSLYSLYKNWGTSELFVSLMFMRMLNYKEGKSEKQLNDYQVT